jgi:biopolymer transport protein ExbB/TolQ
MWAHGLLVALIATAVVASAIVAVLAVVLTALRSRAVTGDEQRPRGVLDILGPRPRR